MKLKNNIAEIIVLLLFIIIFLSSCGVGNLTTHQHQEINKIDKQLNQMWNEYTYKRDSLWIKRDSIIKHKDKLKPCCIKTSNNVYIYEGITIDHN